ncbi:MAG: aminoglycoside phosphotransferase family protein [Candidatus Bathyarchaeia archaeon]|nr:aminoglycoside phosphotransferase family protein [Candidatus Bathyarchaeota archaeon]
MLNREKLEKYLSSIYKSKIKIERISLLSEKEEIEKGAVNEGVKAFGYGKPYLIEFRINKEKKIIVLETMKGDSFGHEFSYDRAHALLFAYSTYNKLPKHAKSIDIGVFMKNGELTSLKDYDEFFILMNKVEGTPYYKDLERILKEKNLTQLDELKAEALSNYLVEIHSLKFSAPNLYKRRLRELFGHGECIMGLIDNYPEGYVKKENFYLIAEKCFKHIWRIREKTYRLCQVHGDFHPWNILFRGGVDFTVLDRSRGEWGEAADDLAAMSINYIFFSLQAFGELKGAFEKLYLRFMENYLIKTGDEEILEVIQPFYAWRCLVLANPIWYPNLNMKIRQKIFNFIFNVLETEKFSIKDVNSYLT